MIPNSGQETISDRLNNIVRNQTDHITIRKLFCNYDEYGGVLESKHREIPVITSENKDDIISWT